MPCSHTILFLGADTGAGHRRAAEAICQALELLQHESGHAPGQYRLAYVDTFSACARFPLRHMSRWYSWSIRYTPWLYGKVFQLTNHTVIFRTVAQVLYPLLGYRLAELLDQLRPDAVVCVHPLVNHVALRARARVRLPVPVVTLMTDLVTPHAGWIAPRVDSCIVPTETAREVCRRGGVPESKIHVLGMPVDLEFTAPGDKAALRRKLGLRPELPMVLLVGGGEGAGKLAEFADAIWRANIPLQLIVVTGRNQRLRRRLQRRAEHLPAGRRQKCRILGFVHNMHELMGAADILVTKAGPSTISEAIACRLPLVLTGYLPGQEEGNVAYVCEQGIGLLAETPPQLVATLAECLRPGSPLLECMRANMVVLQNPLAARSIARFLLGAGSSPVGESRSLVTADAV